MLLDSGSDGDILFQHKGKRKNTVPYTMSLTPQVWQTSMHQFTTKKVGDFELTFPEYSGSKRVKLQPDIMEFNPEDYDRKFDLIISETNMKELGIVLDFGWNMIMIDQIDLPMRSLKELQKPNIVYQMYKNTEPLSTSDLTKRAMRILDAKYEKADLPKVVEACEHLKETEKKSIATLTKV